MGKRTQKLLIYLDQNFLSEMSEADVNEKVRPEFKDINSFTRDSRMRSSWFPVQFCMTLNRATQHT